MKVYVVIHDCGLSGPFVDPPCAYRTRAEAEAELGPAERRNHLSTGYQSAEVVELELTPGSPNRVPPRPVGGTAPDEKRDVAA